MARIVVQGIAGELSGKLGGDVFARNRAGAYVRKNANVLNPNTDAQIRARTAFGVASSQYHVLTPSQKAAWQQFANTSFISKNEKMPGTLSGQNVFNSMRTTALNMNELAIFPGTITINSIAEIPSFSPFETIEQPPSGMLMSGFLGDDDSLNSFQINQIEASSSGGTLDNVIVQLGTNAITNPPDLLTMRGQLTSGDDVEMGFALYASNGMVQDGMFVNNNEQYLISALQPFELANSQPFTDLTLEFSLAQDPADYQALPSEKEACRFSIYQVSKTGMFRLIGAEIVVID